ncbi:molybdopterin-dependent oxidoreductase [Pengzhenrongella frigida]|uniref:Oxidoreductase molybdopterin-binding domain-containing protein n=1 Tax=Pengzhenrongella frigida TaxID=1259133 RepID=A0A4Q5N3Z0_9MICO|nr:molybdopterin-dependent oxidoreductase [Cellulomonas sp. HLT2-17]RYV52920.1 hypothetical protein EUA98_00025 [Cellulomonas sp. HLT2-17]
MDARRRNRTAAATTAIGILGILAACSSTAQASPVVVVHEATLATLSNLEPPTAADVALTVERADGTLVQLSIPQLEALHTVSAELYEPFLDTRVTFQGVPLRDLFAFLEIPASATQLHTVALNEYEVYLPVSIADDPEAILATRADGELIPLDEGGPTRVVLTDDHPQAHDESLWIWSLKILSIP